MSLQPGTRLGPYEILSAIGAGCRPQLFRSGRFLWFRDPSRDSLLAVCSQNGVRQRNSARQLVVCDERAVDLPNDIATQTKSWTRRRDASLGFSRRVDAHRWCVARAGERAEALCSANSRSASRFELTLTLQFSRVDIRDADRPEQRFLPFGDHTEYRDVKFVAPECLLRAQESLAPGWRWAASVVMSHPLLENSPQVPLVQRNQEIQTLAADAAVLWRYPLCGVQAAGAATAPACSVRTPHN